MRIEKYQITIKQLQDMTNKFEVGDLVKIETNRSCHYGEIGIVREVRDERRRSTYMECARDWYYFVEVSRGGEAIKQSGLSLIMKKDQLLQKFHQKQSKGGDKAILTFEIEEVS